MVNEPVNHEARRARPPRCWRSPIAGGLATAIDSVAPTATATGKANERPEPRARLCPPGSVIACV